jgi:hypothetical protein
MLCDAVRTHGRRRSCWGRAGDANPPFALFITRAVCFSRWNLENSTPPPSRLPKRSDHHRAESPTPAKPGGYGRRKKSFWTGRKPRWHELEKHRPTCGAWAANRRPNKTGTTR